MNRIECTHNVCHCFSFPAALEAALEQTLASHPADSALLAVLQEMMALTSMPLKYQLLPESGTCLLLGLSHAQPSMRLLALQQLERSFHDNQVMFIRFP